MLLTSAPVTLVNGSSTRSSMLSPSPTLAESVCVSSFVDVFVVIIYVAIVDVVMQSCLQYEYADM